MIKPAQPTSKSHSDILRQSPGAPKFKTQLRIDTCEIEVRVAPGEIPKVFWTGPSGTMWRIPHDWRRRKIKLPGQDLLLRNNFPLSVAEEFGGRIVAANYHPGSLCCLPDGYRVRDGQGRKWPVRAADCVVVGFGDEAERYA